MCRYSSGPRAYPTSFVCVPCRHVAQFDPQLLPVGVSPRCPSCRAGLVDAGRDFHAPRRRDRRSWAKVGLLLAAGVGFDSCGCAGPGPRPVTLADARAAVRDGSRVGLAPGRALTEPAVLGRVERELSAERARDAARPPARRRLRLASRRTG